MVSRKQFDPEVIFKQLLYNVCTAALPLDVRKGFAFSGRYFIKRRLCLRSEAQHRKERPRLPVRRSLTAHQAAEPQGPNGH